MKTTLWIENLDSRETRPDLLRLFSPHGVVHDASVIVDRDFLRRTGVTGRVEMRSPAAATASIDALNGSFHHGLRISVRLAVRAEIRTATRPVTN